MRFLSRLFGSSKNNDQSDNAQASDAAQTLHTSITRALAGVVYYDSTMGELIRSIARAMGNEQPERRANGVIAALLQALLENGTVTGKEMLSDLVEPKVQRLHEGGLTLDDLVPCVSCFLYLAIEDAKRLHADKSIVNLLIVALNQFGELAASEEGPEKLALTAAKNSPEYRRIADCVDTGEGLSPHTPNNVSDTFTFPQESTPQSALDKKKAFIPFEKELHEAGFDQFLSQQSIEEDMLDLENCLREEFLDAWYGLYGQDTQSSVMANRSIFEAIMGNDMRALSAALRAIPGTDPEAYALCMRIIKNHFLVKGIISENKKLIETALEAGADPNRKCRYQDTSHTPIVAAARTGNTDICKRLIKAGADVNKAQSNSETALANATLLGDTAMVQLLLGEGAKPNAMTHAGTALTQASNTAVLFALLSGGADPNIGDKDDDFPIITFINEKRYETVFALKICGTDLRHKNKDGLSAIDYARKYGNDKMIQILTGDNYRVQLPSVKLGPMRAILESRVRKLLTFSYPLNYYPMCKAEKYHSLVTESQKEREERAGRLVQRAIAAKREGDLEEANRLYLEVVADEDVLVVDYVWGWFKVLLLAKNFEEAQLVLRYYHALAVSKNYMLRYESELDFEETAIQECFLTMNFDAYDVFLNATSTWPLGKRGVEEKIALFGGSEYWKSYSLKREEYDNFIRYFGYPEKYDSIDWPDRLPDSGLKELEEAILSNSPSAYPKLARLIYETDEKRAIELCEKGISAGDTDDAPFLIALLTSEDNPEKAKELYQLCIDNGHCYAAANNLGVLVQDDDPKRAEELFQMSIDDGSHLTAARNLANLVRESDPERAKELYRMAVDAGDRSSSAFQLALLVETEDPEQAEKLYEKAANSGNTDAFAKLARLTYDRDRESAIALCKKAMEDNAMSGEVFNLAFAIYKTDPESAKKLYQLCIDNGRSYAAANNLATLVEKDNPERAKELYQMAVDAGNHLTAARNLANLVRESDPERAKELYRMAVDAGDESSSAFQLALLVEEEDPEQAEKLYTESIDAGNSNARPKLARLIYKNDRERAINLCEEAVSAGDTDDGAFFLAWLLENDDPERAKELYRLCIDNGNRLHDAPNNLGLLIQDTEPDRAKRLFRISIDAGNSYFAANNLARLIQNDDPEKAEMLYQMSINGGNRQAAARNLANLVKESDPERAKLLFQTAIDAGDKFTSTLQLALLVEKNDEERAVHLYANSVDAGNANAFPKLVRLAYKIERGTAIPLCKAAIETDGMRDGVFYFALEIADSDSEMAEELYQLCIDNKLHLDVAANNLGVLVQKEDPERAKKLFKMSIDAGNSYYATNNLGKLIEEDDPEKSLALFQAAVDAGNPGAAYNYIALVKRVCPDKETLDIETVMSKCPKKDRNDFGTFFMSSNRDKAVSIFEDCIDAGDKAYAPCNLAHMIAESYPDRAESLYRLSLENETCNSATEALIGLGILLEKSSPEEAKTFLDAARERDNLQDSIDFMVDYYDSVGSSLSERIRKAFEQSN